MDKTFEQEQAHLKEVYQTILELRDELTAELDESQATAAQDLLNLSDEIRPDVAGIEADEAMETLAAIETLNAVIDAYNQRQPFQELTLSPTSQRSASRCDPTVPPATSTSGRSVSPTSTASP